MLDMEDNVYKNKYAVKSALGSIKVLRKLSKIQKEELERFNPEREKYLNSEEYRKL